MNLNIGSWNVGGQEDYLQQIMRVDSKKAKNLNEAKGTAEERTKLINETRVPSIVNIIKERIKESPIMCLQEVDQSVFEALLEAGMGVVWDGHDAAIVFDINRVDKCEVLATGEKENTKLKGHYNVGDTYIIADLSVDGRSIRVASQHLNPPNPFNPEQDYVGEKISKTGGLHQFTVLTNKLDELEKTKKADLEVIGMDANVAMIQDDGMLARRLEHAKDKNFKFDEKADNATVYNKFHDLNIPANGSEIKNPDIAKTMKKLAEKLGTKKTRDAMVYHRTDYIIVRGSNSLKDPIINEDKEKFDLKHVNYQKMPSDHRPIRATIKVKKLSFKERLAKSCFEYDDFIGLVNNKNYIIQKSKKEEDSLTSTGYILKYVKDGKPRILNLKLTWDGKVIGSHSNSKSVQYDSFEHMLKLNGIESFEQTMPDKQES